MRLFRFLFQLALIAFFIVGVYSVGKQLFSTPEPVAPPVISHSIVLEEITSIGKLELVKYNFKDVIEYEKGLTKYNKLNNFLSKYGGNKAKAVLIVSGEAVGCIDLTKISQNDIVEDGDTVIVYLPKPELCVYKINHGQSKVYDTENTYMIEEGAMINEAFVAAEKQISKSALKMGILKQTEENAEKILIPILEKISGKTVLLRSRLTGDLSEVNR